MTLNFVIENDVVLSYRRLSYTHWHALAEFVDNSTQAYFDSKAELDARLIEEGETLEVRITYDRNAGEIRITDNSIGMSYSELERASQNWKTTAEYVRSVTIRHGNEDCRLLAGRGLGDSHQEVW